MKTNISLRSIAALLLIAVPSMSIVSCTDDEDLADLSVPESTVTLPAEEWVNLKVINLEFLLKILKE